MWHGDQKRADMETEHKQRYIIDQVGEETDLKECALCYAASCFACVSDHCTALKKLADGGFSGKSVEIGPRFCYNIGVSLCSRAGVKNPRWQTDA